MTDQTTINRVCEHLEKYVFDKVWNDPYSEYRTFVDVRCLNPVAATGIFFGRYSQIQLPSEVPYKASRTTSFFYVFAVPVYNFRTLKFNTLEWTRLDAFCSGNLIDVEFFCANGRRVIRNAVFVRQADKNDCMLIAVERTAFEYCLGMDVDVESDHFYFGRYFDSDLVPSIQYVDYRLNAQDLPANQKRADAVDPVVKPGEDAPTYILYNGRLLTGDYSKKVAAGSFIEKVFDKNIVGIIDVNCDPIEGQVYESIATGRRVLVHIPKSINTNHVIITPNTCDLYLVPTEMHEGTAEISGTYLYQCGREEKFHQVTHNDFSIDYEWLQTLATTYGFKKWYVRVFVRIQDQEKKAIRDANYLNILYSHTDEEIVDFLLGRAEYKIDFWTAKHLEDSPYAKALLWRRNMGDFKQKSFEEYIDIIGYYHTLALIGKRVTYFEVVENKMGQKFKVDPDKKGKDPRHPKDAIPVDPRHLRINEFVVRAPLALGDLAPEDFKAIVYHNGLRVDQEKVTVATGFDVDNKYHKELVFTPDASWWTKVIEMNYAQRLRVIVDNEEFQIGDKVVVEIYDNRHDGSVRYFRMDSTRQGYKQTTDTEFKAHKQYFVRFSDQFYAKATLRPEYIGQPIDGIHEYDVGIKDDHKEPVLYKDFFEMENPLEIQMVTDDEWTVYRMNEETDATNLVYYPIDNPGSFNPTTRVLTLDPQWTDYDLAVVEGPLTRENGATFTIDQFATGILGNCTGKPGQDLWPTKKDILDDPTKFDETNNFPLENELVFLNGKRLVRGLDYAMEGYNPASFHSGAKLYLQNVSYLKKESKYQLIRTNQSTLSLQRGWIRGNIIQWNHQNPFWFDELSVLTINGDVCADIVHELGTITITDPQSHDNGTPYEFRMSVSTKVKNLVGNYGEKLDHDRLEVIKAYFDAKYRKPDFITVVKKAHKIYSLFTEAIVTEYVRPGSQFDFVLTPSQQIFEQQFEGFTDWKRRDVCFTMDHEDLKYVDIYPLFNRLQADNRYEYHKISELARRLLPSDQYRHKDSHNVK